MRIRISNTEIFISLNLDYPDIQDAWRLVTDEKSPINWALFSYEGHTNTLGLLGQGEEGIEELTEELNPSKIIYAFLRVEDPKTSLPKYVILNWQVD